MAEDTARQAKIKRDTEFDKILQRQNEVGNYIRNIRDNNENLVDSIKDIQKQKSKWEDLQSEFRKLNEKFMALDKKHDDLEVKYKDLEVKYNEQQDEIGHLNSKIDELVEDAKEPGRRAEAISKRARIQ